jgi:hypothetical protein
VNTFSARVAGFLEDPIVCRRIVTAAAWCGVGMVAVMPEMAWAAIPIPGLDRFTTDIQDHVTTQGSIGGATLGLAAGAVRMMLSNFEMGIGGVVKTGAGGAVIGASPEAATYLTT